MIVDGESRDAEFVGDFSDGNFTSDQLFENVDVDFVMGAARPSDLTALISRRRRVHVARQRMVLLLLWLLLLMLLLVREWDERARGGRRSRLRILLETPGSAAGRIRPVLNLVRIFIHRGNLLIATRPTAAAVRVDTKFLHPAEAELTKCYLFLGDHPV